MVLAVLEEHLMLRESLLHHENHSVSPHDLCRHLRHFLLLGPERGVRKYTLDATVDEPMISRFGGAPIEADLQYPGVPHRYHSLSK